MKKAARLASGAKGPSRSSHAGAWHLGPLTHALRGSGRHVRFGMGVRNPGWLADRGHRAAVGSSGSAPEGVRYVVYEGEVKARGDRNWRNNNPGNIEFGPFARSKGALSSDGRFAIFPDWDSGLSALDSLLEGRYGDRTIEQMMQAYAPPSENDTERYIQHLEARTGLSRRAVIGDLSRSQMASLAAAITLMEGGRAGSVYTLADARIPAWARQLLQGGENPVALLDDRAVPRRL